MNFKFLFITFPDISDEFSNYSSYNISFSQYVLLHSMTSYSTHFTNFLEDQRRRPLLIEKNRKTCKPIYVVLLSN